MRRFLFLAMTLLAVTATAAFAQPHGRMGEMFGDGPYREEADAILDGYEDRVPAELTFGEIEQLAGQLSIPAQKAAFVARSAASSFFVPGSGQFMNEEPAAGALFLAGSVAIKTGTLLGVYFLLPEALRFDQLDYFNTPGSEIKDTWTAELEEITLAETLPIYGVVLGGALADLVLSGFSARHAGRLAARRIDAGDVTFEPRPEIIMLAPGRIGIGFGFDMSY